MSGGARVLSVSAVRSTISISRCENEGLCRCLRSQRRLKLPVAGAIGNREVRKMPKLAIGSLVLALPVSMQAQAESQVLAQISTSTDAGTLRPPELVRTPIP